MAMPRSETKSGLYKRIDKMESTLSAVKKQTRPKPTTPGEKALGKLDAISDGIKLGKELYDKVKASCKFCTSILNQTEGMMMEIVTQSSSDIHSKVDGKYLVAPDPFIPYKSFTHIVTQKRENGAFGNANGVIYKMQFAKAEDECHVVIAWRNPIRGRAHFYVNVTKDKSCVKEDFMADLRNSFNTSLLYSPEAGLSKDPTKNPKDGISIEAVATFTDERLQVIIRPRSIR
jgi:hypothetical protein